MSVTAGRSWPSHFTVRASLGAVLDGTVRDGGERSDVGAGLVGSIGVARQWQFGADRQWFVTGTAGFSLSRATTALPGMESISITATDARVGAMVGRALGAVRPYLLVRGFAGPVSWRRGGQRVTGGDVHHFQLGFGGSVALPANLAVIVDVSLLGERAGSLGMAFAL